MDSFVILVLIVTIIIMGYQHKVYMYMNEVERTINDLENEMENFRKILSEIYNDIYEDDNKKDS